VTLSEFLREQLDADERVANRACVDAMNEIVSGRWEVSAHTDTPSCVADDEGRMIVDSATSYPQYEQGVLAHVAAWDPARALAEVKAKRAILDAHDRRRHHCPLPIIQSAVGQLWDLDDDDAAPACWTVLLLAQPYADRDGWQPDWSVD